MELMQTLEKMYNLISEVGWVQEEPVGRLRDGRIVGYCLTGALYKISDEDDEIMDALEAIRDEIAPSSTTIGELTLCNVIELWNDNSMRTREEVLDMLKRAMMKCI